MTEENTFTEKKEWPTIPDGTVAKCVIKLVKQEDLPQWNDNTKSFDKNMCKPGLVIQFSCLEHPGVTIHAKANLTYSDKGKLWTIANALIPDYCMELQLWTPEDGKCAYILKKDRGAYLTALGNASGTYHKVKVKRKEGSGWHNYVNSKPMTSAEVAAVHEDQSKDLEFLEDTTTPADDFDMDDIPF